MLLLARILHDGLCMKLAITVWNGRVAPLFDVAKHLVVFETEGFGKPVSELTAIQLLSDEVGEKTDALEALGISAVICGGISREYEEALLDAGIDMDTFVAGDIAEVIAAWEAGTLRREGFSMPGCPCPRHRCMRRGQRNMRRRGGNGGPFGRHGSGGHRFD